MTNGQGAPGRRDHRRQSLHPSTAGAAPRTRELDARKQARPTIPRRRRRPGRVVDSRRTGTASGRGGRRAQPCGLAARTHAGSPETAYFTLAPDWVCEVLSSATRRVDLHEKRPVYARESVAHLWLVDPTDRTLEVFELRDGQWVLIATATDDDLISIRPFDAITFSLGDLWR